MHVKDVCPCHHQAIKDSAVGGTNSDVGAHHTPSKCMADVSTYDNRLLM
jgi:hypothetical protein